MAEPAFIAGDWGTSHLRLALCDAEGRALAHAQGPGAAAIRGDFAGVFDALVRPWHDRHGPLPAMLCGMVGSTIGWAEVPYVACPVQPKAVARGCLALHGGAVRIVPGLSCRNRLGAPDVMRGEETQILGALAEKPELRRGRHLLCLPGTHTKWAALEDGTVRDFLTAPTGEVYALLAEHSVLVARSANAAAASDRAAFGEGLAEFNRRPRSQILHRLFECRSRRLSGELAEADAAPFLSGLLIASDVAGALELFGDVAAERTVHLIGAPQLAALYREALSRLGVDSQVLDGSTASLAGLAHVHGTLTASTAVHDA